MKIRITHRVAEFMRGSQAWYDRDKPGTGEDPETIALMRKLAAARARADKSYTLDLDTAEVGKMWDWADYLATAAGDELGDPDNRADWNAAQACKRQIDRARQTA